MSLIQRVNCSTFALVTETASELGIKKTVLMQYIEDNPKLFDVTEATSKSTKGVVKSLGLAIRKVYLTPTEHIVVNGKTMFRTWRRRLVPVPDRKDLLKKADFGWEPIWYDLETFVKNGKNAGYLTEEEVPREAMQPLRRGSSGIGVLPQQDKKRRS